MTGGLQMHSAVGGSGMHRWRHDRCAGSVALAQHYPNLSSYASIEGTAAHDLAEHCYNDNAAPSDYIDTIGSGDVVIDAHMAECVDEYIAFCRGIDNVCDWSAVEHAAKMPEHDQVFGTIDHVARNSTHCYVTDLKYGYAPVAADCDQLKYYAALIRATVGASPNYVLTIYQPRVFRAQPAVSITITDNELCEWINNELQPSVNLALSVDAPRKAGDWCRYCPAKIDCPEAVAALLNLTAPLPHCSNDTLAAILNAELVAKGVIDAAKTEGIRRIMSGQSITGFKPIRRTARGKISDNTGFVTSMVSAGVNVSDMHDVKLKSLTDLKKLNNKIVEQFTTRDDGKVTIAPLTDPSPAIQTLNEQFGVPTK